MKIRTPILYDKEGNEIGWLEQDIPIEMIAQLRWEWAHIIKNGKLVYLTPIIGEKEGNNE